MGRCGTTIGLVRLFVFALVFPACNRVCFAFVCLAWG